MILTENSKTQRRKEEWKVLEHLRCMLTIVISIMILFLFYKN